MDVDGYRSMVEAGVDGLTIYQETYDRSCTGNSTSTGRSAISCGAWGPRKGEGKRGCDGSASARFSGWAISTSRPSSPGCTRSISHTASGAPGFPSPSRASGRRKAGSLRSTRSATGRWCRGSAPCASFSPIAA
jgi:hypothetical protein